MLSTRQRPAAQIVISLCKQRQGRRHFSPDNRPAPHYNGHVPLTLIERAALAVGAGVGAFFNPRRADFIAVLGEATAQPFFIDQLRDTMLKDDTGRQILRERPRITSQSLDLNHLRNDLPPGSLGRTYVEWLDLEGVTPDTRLPVKYIDDPECAYVMQRYRECHDFYHALTGLPIIIEGEISLKAFEYANTGLPMAGIGALLAPLRLKPKQRQRLCTIYFPWAIRNGLSCKPLINVYWEKILDRPVEEIRAELGVEKPPNLRQLRKKKEKIVD